MNNKKIQANMQINVGFIADTTELVKQVEGKFKQLNLGSSLFSGVSTGLDKNFKDIQSNLDKMFSGLGKRGLSAKQYENIFTSLNDNIRRSIDNVKELGTELTKAFNSDKNKEYLKQLEEQKKLLEEIEKINAKRKSANTRANTNASKASENFGIDFTNKATAGMLDDIIERRASGIKKLTPTQQNSILGGLNEEQLKKVITLYNQYLEQLRTANNYTKEMQQLSGAKGSGDEVVKTIQARIDKLDKESITQEELNALVAEYNRLYDQLNHTTSTLGGDFDASLSKGTTHAEELAKTGATFKEILGQFGIVFSAAKIAKVFKDLIKYSFDFYKSLDSALNQIYVVSNLSSNAVSNLTSNFINMAKQTGMSIDDVTRAAVLFYQQGLNTDEVLIMTEVTAQFAKVAGIDATDAADKLTAAVNGYCLAAEDAISVADKFNKVAAASAADINELSTAFSKAAAQANQAGVSMDNYLAYIATMEEATREAPENLGTSLKTIFSRMQQIKTGENTEEGVDVNSVETALKSVGIALRDTTGQLRDLEEIFDELGPKWQSLDRNTQAYLGTIIAGTRQQSRFITLMQNWDRVMELAAESENSAGQQALMHAKAMDSIESKLQQLTVSWQEFVSNLSDSKIFKGVIDVLKGLINLLNSGNQPLTMLSLTLVALAKPIQKLGEAGGEKLKNLWTNLKEWHTNFSGDKMQNAASALEQLGQEIDEINLKLKQQNLTTEEREVLVEELDLKERTALKAQIALLDEKAKHEKALAQGAVAAGAAISGIGLMVSNNDQNMGGLVSAMGGIVSSIGLAFTNPVAAAVTAISTITNLVITLVKWSDRLKEKMTNAVNSVKEAAQEFANTTTEYKTTDQLIKKYEQLSKAVFRTSKEQEELNKVIQDLGDLHDIETIADEYGNLHINITEAKQALKDLETEQQKQAKSLREKEIRGAYDATSGWFNSNTPDQFYDELFATSSAEYKSLLNTIDDKLTTDSRAISSSLAKTFTANLNTELQKEVKRNRYNYIDEGFGNAMLRMNKNFNEKLSTSDWNSLYEELNYLQTNINEMSFKDVQENIDNFYNNWSGKNKLMADEWDALKNTINGTVFENSSLLDFYNEVGTMGSKINGEYYRQQKKAIEEQKKLYKTGALNQGGQAFVTGVGIGGGFLAGGAAGAKAGAAIGTGILPGIGTAIGAAGGAILGGLAGWGLGELLKTDAQKEYEALLKVEERLEKQRKNYAKELAKEWGVSTKEAKKLLDVQLQISDVMQGLTMDTQNFLSNITELYSNTENMSSKAAKEYADILQNSLNSVEGVQGDAHKTNALIAMLTQNMEGASSEVKLKLQKVIDEAFNNLALPANYTFTQLIDQLDTVSEDLRTMNSIMEEFNENGYISIDTFKDLAKILDNVSLDNLYAVSDLENGINYVDQYITALKNLQLAYNEENGAIGLNGEALESLQSIQEAITRSKIVSLKNELIARRAQVEAEIAYIDAQIAGTQAAIKAIKAANKAKIKSADVEKKANKAVQESFSTSVDAINEHYATDIQNFNTWSVAVLGGLSAATEAWGRYWKAVAGEGAEDLSDLYEKAQKATTNVSWTPYKALNVENRFGNTLDKEEQETLLGELDDLLIELDNSRQRYAKELDALDIKIEFLDNLAGSDLSKWGAKASSSAKQLEKYIGKLKEIYNILNRIQVLEHRLSMLDAYSEVARGEYYGDLLQERLSYNNELLKQYQFLTMERKKQANGYKEFIQEIEGLEGVFDFDKYGQIIINWEKYMALQDEAINGEVTMKQKADDVYDAYTGIFKEVQDYLSKTIDYYKKVIQLGREMVDAYISLQNRTANAVKEIYKDILDTKLDAIDREKEAIEELRKERERANKEAKDAKEIAGIQSDIQRAMMDTSGASATALIKAQGRLDDKLSSVGEDKYTEMLNDITNRLDEEKEMLQQEFDDMFDDLNWLFTELDDNIMNNLDLVNGILNQTQDWRQKSKLEQADEQEKRDKEFYSYFGKTLEGEEGIYNIYRKIGDIKDNIKTLDEGAVTNIAEATAEIWQTLESWEKNGNPVRVSNASAFYGGGGGGGGGGTPPSPKPSNNPTGGDKVSPASGSYTITLDNGYNMCTYKTVKAGQSVSLPALDRAGYKFNGWSIPSLGMCSNGAFTYKPTKSETVTALWAPQTSSATNPKNSSTKPFSISTSPWMPAGVSVGGVHASGGLVNYTGLGWLDGTPQNPEMVLDALQTKHFINFANTLDKMYSQPTASNNSITIDTISFNVESMSSPEDGEKAFTAFVNKFNEIGSQTGLKFNNFKNTL